MLILSKTEGGSCVRMQRLVPLYACSSFSEMQSKCALSSTCEARLTTVNRTIYCPGTRAPGGPGSSPLKSRVTRWLVRVRPPEFGGYPFVAGTRRVAYVHSSMCKCYDDHVRLRGVREIMRCKQMHIHNTCLHIYSISQLTFFHFVIYIYIMCTTYLLVHTYEYHIW